MWPEPRRTSVAVTSAGWSAVAAHEVVIDPFGDQPTGLIQCGLGMMKAIQRGARLERRQVVRTQLAQVAIGGDNGAFAASGDLADVRIHLRTFPIRCESFAIADVGYVAARVSAIRRLVRQGIREPGQSLPRLRRCSIPPELNASRSRPVAQAGWGD